MADLAYAFAPIFKSAPQADGSLLVYGLVSDSSLDLDQQRCSPSFLNRALPNWFTIGNVREQHDPHRAVGKATEYETKGDGHYITAKIVDPVAKAKTEAGVFTGFSIGVKNPRIVKSADAPGGLIDGGEVIEVSLCDRPANVNSTLTLVKSATPGMSVAPECLDEERMLVKVEELTETAPTFTPADMAKVVAKSTVAAQPAPSTVTINVHGGTVTESPDASKGAMPPLKPGGPDRYPITTVQDLKDAIQAFGRGKESDKDQIKAHIKSEAKRLGRPDLVPDNWKGAGADLTKAGMTPPGSMPPAGMKHDPTQLQTILNGLAQCMQAELDELCNGENELCDLQELLCSLQMFCNWWCGEAANGETTAPYDDGGSGSVTTMSVDTDLAKAGAMTDDDDGDAKAQKKKMKSGKKTSKKNTPPADADGDDDATGDDDSDDDGAGNDDGDADDAQAPKAKNGGKLAPPFKKGNKTSAPKSAESDLTELVTSATKSLEDRLTAMEADLAKALALPQPGGPVITRNAAQAAAAKQTDADVMRRQAETLMEKAMTMEPYDQRLANGWRTQAAKLLKEAAA